MDCFDHERLFCREWAHFLVPLFGLNSAVVPQSIRYATQACYDVIGATTKLTLLLIIVVIKMLVLVSPGQWPVLLSLVSNSISAFRPGQTTHDHHGHDFNQSHLDHDSILIMILTITTVPTWKQLQILKNIERNQTMKIIANILEYWKKSNYENNSKY